MKLCAAQLCPTPGRIEENLRRHRELVAEAAASRADLILFPELSLTGYEPELADRLALHVDDERLAALQHLSDLHGLVIGAGLPVIAPGRPLIGLLFFRPNLPRRLYAKTMLYADEVPWFLAGTENIIIEAAGLRIAPAICFESLHTSHAERAAEMGADIYLAAVAKSAAGLTRAEAHYPMIAARHGMTVLMANCVGACDNFTAMGRSAAWNE